MAETLSLMEFLQALLTDAELRGAFGHDPQGTLAAHGLADLTPADVHDALVLVQDNQTVDYSLDAVATAPPPPPPAGDGHGAAVEYLARYLADPMQAGTDEQWADLDPDAAVAPAPGAPGDAPLGAFGTGHDLGYGAGAGEAPAEHGVRGDDWGRPEGTGSADPVGAHGDLAGYDLGTDDVDDLGVLGSLGSDDLDDLGGDDLDDLGALGGDDLDREGPDEPGAPLPGA